MINDNPVHAVMRDTNRTVINATNYDEVPVLNDPDGDDSNTIIIKKKAKAEVVYSDLLLVRHCVDWKEEMWWELVEEL